MDIDKLQVGVVVRSPLSGNKGIIAYRGECAYAHHDKLCIFIKIDWLGTYSRFYHTMCIPRIADFIEIL